MCWWAGRQCGSTVICAQRKTWTCWSTRSAPTARGLFAHLNFLAAARELDAEWFVPTSDGNVENIRVADDPPVDLLFSANGENYESVQPYVREPTIEGTPVKVLATLTV